MNAPDNIELLTVGQLVEELAEFEEEYSDWDVVCWTPDGDPCYPTSVGLDENGDLCIALKQDDGENYNVSMLLEELDEYDEGTLVYVKACGLYLNIEVNEDGTIFEEDYDEESDIDVIACHGCIFDEYEDDGEEVDSLWIVKGEDSKLT